MKIKARVSFLISADYYGGTTLCVKDDTSCISFLEIKVSQEQLALLLSRMADVKCEAEVRGLEFVGKEKEGKQIEFPLPEEASFSNEKEIAIKISKKIALDTGEGWQADCSFSSQTSFFNKEGKRWARGHLFRFVDPKEKA